MHVARVVVHAVVGLMLILIARVIVIVFVVEFPYPVFCIRRYTLYNSCQSSGSKHSLAATTLTKERMKSVANCYCRSQPNFCMDVPSFLFLQLDVVVLVDVWECTGASFPLSVLWLQACELLVGNQVAVSSVLVLAPSSSTPSIKLSLIS